jgi:hypothetical protein
LEFFIDIDLPAAQWPWVQLTLLQKSPESNGSLCIGLTALTNFMHRFFGNSGSLKPLEALGLSSPVKGSDEPYASIIWINS